MTVARVTEIKSSSIKSFDDAIKTGVARAQKTLTQVRAAWIENQAHWEMPWYPPDVGGKIVQK